MMVTISIEESKLKHIDDYCNRHMLKRSTFLVAQALAKIDQENIPTQPIVENVSPATPPVLYTIPTPVPIDPNEVVYTKD